MIFTNFSFFLFFIIFLCSYSFINKEFKKYILLIGNLFFCFYAGWQSFIVAITVVLVTYFLSYFNKIGCYIGICINVFILIFFKYFSSFYPVGISFYTFTCIAYLSDVTSKTCNHEKNIVNFSNYILFFPKLISGPVERGGNFLPQVTNLEEKNVTFENLQIGFHYVLFGVFKKLCIANRLQIYVDKVFDNLLHFGGLSLMIAAIFYSIQLYCDFSGYTDIAIGVARIFGFKLTQNFKNPYSSVSIGDFWHKWHISLSSWLKDYIYIPLGGNRKGKIKKYINILITFLISGMWHGNTMNFLIWGGLHAIFQIIENIFCRQISKINLKIRNLITIFLVLFAWIFFRLNHFSDIYIYFLNLFSKNYMSISSIKKSLYEITFSTYNNMTPSIMLNINVYVSLLILFIVSRIEVQKNKHISEIIICQNKIIRYFFDYLLIFCIFTIGVFDSTRFIYAAF